MLLTDVNVLIYAADTDSDNYKAYRDWLDDMRNGPEPYGVFDLVLSSFIRIATNPRVFNVPMETEKVLKFASDIRHDKNAVILTPGSRHWEIFADLCRKVQAKNKTVPDAYFAALAIAHDCEWISADRSFAKFPGLRWRHPLDG